MAALAALPYVTVETGVVTKLDLGGTGVRDAGVSALAASLKGSQLETLYLRECLVFCSERRRHPAVTNDAILGTDVAPYPLQPFASVVIFRLQLRWGRRGVRVGGGTERIQAHVPEPG